MGDATFSTRVASGKGWGALREGGACPRGPPANRRCAGVGEAQRTREPKFGAGRARAPGQVQ